MLTGLFRTLLTPRYPRRYVGRHRARITIRVVVRNPARADAALEPEQA